MDLSSTNRPRLDRDPQAGPPPPGGSFPMPAACALLRLMTLLLVVGCWTALPHTLHAAGIPDKVPEFELKAAWLLNFIKFTEWPFEAFDSDTQPMLVGVLGVDPFGDSLEKTLAGKQARSRPIVVKRFSSVRDTTGCHVLYISASETRRESEILKALHRKHILTIGESTTFLDHGGTVQFLRQDNRVRFDISLESANQAGLKISPNLLRITRKVRGVREEP